MAKAIRINAVGGPDVMEYVDVEAGEPGPGEARVRQAACGLNYIDVYFRTGAYPQPLPAGLGMEGAGVVEAIGAGVAHVKPGDRVAYAGRPTGAYAEVRVMPAAILVKLPESIRQGHLHRIARLPRTARHDGQFRQRVRSSAAVRLE